MKIDFRIDVGYQYANSSKQYHPVFVWDGILKVDKGEIIKTFKLDYPFSPFGTGRTPTETLLDRPEWRFSTQREIVGLRFIAEVESDATFTFHTRSCHLTFTAKELMEKGRIENDVGAKYLGCFADITRTGYYWYMQDDKKSHTTYHAKDLVLVNGTYAKMQLAFLNARSQVSVNYTVKNTISDYMETCLHMVSMALTDITDKTEPTVSAKIPFHIFCDGRLVATFHHHFRAHNGHQLLEDSWVNLRIPSGTHAITIKNSSPNISVGINRLVLYENEFNDGDLIVPEWAVSGQTELGKVFSLRDQPIKIQVGDKLLLVHAKAGWNQFKFPVEGKNTMIVRTSSCKKDIELINAVQNPVKVGFDLTCAPHDDSLWIERLLDYTYYTRLGNFVAFKNYLINTDEFTPLDIPNDFDYTDDDDIQTEEYQQLDIFDQEAEESTYSKPIQPEITNGEVVYTSLTDQLMYKWGKLCQNYKIWASACRDFNSGAIVRGADQFLNDCGYDDYTDAVNAYQPCQPWDSQNMKQASKNYTNYLKYQITKTKEVSPSASFGDASGGSKYAYLAGVDYIRAKALTSHTQRLLSEVRPSAESLGNGKWGVDITTQQAYLSNRENHLSKYFLSLMQPWIMGADAVYDQDSLWAMYTDERLAWDDSLTRGKRQMMRSFYKLTNTVGRPGQNKRKIAVLNGRYSAPLSGFDKDGEQYDTPCVWGLFGKKDDENWKFSQPEKSHQLMDLLMPGACAIPFKQKFDKVRFDFSGTPFGDFDYTPIGASQDYLNNYSLLLNLGWNTMLKKDYAKLKSFVENGGVLVTAIPQFSTHIERDFLADMQDLSLFNDGDIQDLTGVKVLGRGEKYSGQYNSLNRSEIISPNLSTLYSDNPLEDGEGYLAEVEVHGAEVVAWDTSSGKPMLVKFPLGDGYVYTFTIWAYPGHEQFKQFSADWINQFLSDARGATYIEDSTGDVFWTTWVDGNITHIMALNTDYTKKDNLKRCKLMINNRPSAITVKEGVCSVYTIVSGTFTTKEYTL